MRPRVAAPFAVRGVEYGGAKPLFCIPLVAADLMQLLAQAKIAHELAADLVEWRADFNRDVTAAGFVDSSSRLRGVLKEQPIIFTLRIKAEGGAQEISQETRRACIEAVTASGFVDIIDVELQDKPVMAVKLERLPQNHAGRNPVCSEDNFSL